MNWKQFIAFKVLGLRDYSSDCQVMKDFINELEKPKKEVIAMFELVDWQEIDKKTLKEFLECDTGKKLIACMTNHECNAAALTCTKDNEYREFMAGEVSGLRKQKTMILSMATVEEAQKSSGSVKLGNQDNEPITDDIKDLINEAAREPVLG